MQPVLTAAEMREADRRTIEDVGVPGALLMENAGAAVARVLRERFASARRIAVLCGKGNNGGDGFVAARHLRESTPVVLLFGRRGDVRGDAATHLAQLEQAGISVIEIATDGAWDGVRDDVLSADVVVDALLGTGLRETPEGVLAHAIGDVSRSRVRVLAVDIASGVSSDTGTVAGPAVSAAVTVTFAALKHGHVLPPACDHAGELVIADIGIPEAMIAAVGPGLWLLRASDAARAYPPRRAAAHKGDFGHLLAVAGSLGKTGAAVLCGTAALRAGAGLVTVATAADALPALAGARAELMTEPLEPHTAVARSLELAERCDAAVIGPGWGRAAEAAAAARAFVAGCAVPVVVDADGLSALADAGPHAWPVRRAATVLTPHPGEMARLAGRTTADVQADRLGTARAFARRTGTIVVLKGQRTIVAEPSGRAAVNPTGNPGMAKGGTGDALAGIVGALLARGCDGWTAATAGVYVHGRAGDLAAGRHGQESMLAGDLIDALGDAIRSLPEGHA